MLLLLPGVIDGSRMFLFEWVMITSLVEVVGSRPQADAQAPGCPRGVPGGCVPRQNADNTPVLETAGVPTLAGIF